MPVVVTRSAWMIFCLPASQRPDPHTRTNRLCISRFTFDPPFLYAHAVYAVRAPICVSGSGGQTSPLLGRSAMSRPPNLFYTSQLPPGLSYNTSYLLISQGAPSQPQTHCPRATTKYSSSINSLNHF